MPLPDEVINRLSQEKSPTVGWSSGLLGFAIGLLVVVVFLYAGMAFAYQPYLNGQISAVGDQLNKASQSVNANQQGSLVAYYSQVAHVKSLLAGHITFSSFLTWLGKNTGANVFYNSLLFTSSNQVSLSVLARSQADLDQQIAIFESDPNISNVSVSNVSVANVSGFIQANLTLTVKPTLLTSSQ